MQMSISNLNRVPCKCRWKCRKYIDLSREKSPKKPESYVDQMQNHALIYIYIYIHTRTPTPTKRLTFQAFPREQVHEIRDWLQKISMSIEKTWKCRAFVDVDSSSKCRPNMVDICAPPCVGQTPGEPEESRLTKAQYTCSLKWRLFFLLLVKEIM